jgi:hypothetical protein
MNYKVITDAFTLIGGGAAALGAIIGAYYGTTVIEACELKCQSNIFTEVPVQSCLQGCPNIWAYAALGAFVGLLFMAYGLWRGSRENKIG